MPQREHIKPPPAPAQADTAESLRKLDELHASGVLTDAELESLRARLSA